MGRLLGKIVVITGSASGIGEACAQRCCDEGAQVVIADINKTKGRSVALKLGALFVHLDVTKKKEWEQAQEKILKELGQWDVLINSAGIIGFSDSFGPQDVLNVSLDDWRYIQAVNVEGTMLGCQQAIKAMVKKAQEENITPTGSIINLSSRSGVVGIPMAAAYAASKAAIRNHSKSVALYCASQGWKIRCNTLMPAFILSPMWDPILGAGKQREETLKHLISEVPLKEAGHPDDVAWASVYLASDEARYITGAELDIDGGILAGSTVPPKKAEKYAD